MRAAKRAARAAAADAVRRVTRESAARQGEAVAAELAGLAEWRRAAAVLAFVSVDGEVDTAPLVRRAFDDGKRLYVPRVAEGGGGRMSMLRAASAEEVAAFPPGRWGLREPPADPPRELALEDADVLAGRAVVVLPGAAFDASGRRLGRGGGFYDRYVGELRRAAKAAGGEAPPLIGVCLAEQVLDEVPVEDHDVAVSRVVRGTP